MIKTHSAVCQKTMNENLKAKVEARNVVNAEHNRLLPILAAAFKPFVGQKILKVDGSLLAKFENLVPQTGGKIFSAFKQNSNYTLSFVLRSCVNDSVGGCAYDQATVYVGNICGGTLESLIDPQPLRADYTVEDVLKARQALKEAKQAVDRANSNLAGFGEYDR